MEADYAYIKVSKATTGGGKGLGYLRKSTKIMPGWKGLGYYRCSREDSLRTRVQIGHTRLVKEKYQAM